MSCTYNPNDDGSDDDDVQRGVQGKLEPEKHPWDRRECDDTQPRHHHQVPVEGSHGRPGYQVVASNILRNWFSCQRWKDFLRLETMSPSLHAATAPLTSPRFKFKEPDHFYEYRQRCSGCRTSSWTERKWWESTRTASSQPPLSGQKSTSSPTLEEYIILQDLQRRNSAICCQEKLWPRL